MFRFQTVVACCLWFGVVAAVHAGPLDEAKAKAHLQAVAAGDHDTLMRDYADDAYLDWVGGPLDGRYRGKAAIGEVWKKFIANNGGKPRQATFGKPESHANAAGATIAASADYGGEKPVKVRHVLTYRDGVLTTEIWQISPNLHVAP
jgi:ketosteroid isomerase-like protein